MPVTTQEVIARALDALPELLDRKMESEADYSPEDVARMRLEMNAAGALADQLNDGGRVVVLSADAYAMVCGLVAPSEEGDHKRGVHHAGVFGPIEEVQSTFPTDDFWSAVNGVDPDDEDAVFRYDREAGY